MTEQLWFVAFGWLGSILVVWSLMVARVLRFRWMNFAGSVIATIYNLAIELWPFFAMNLAIAIIDAVWIWKLTRERHDDAVYKVIPVAPGDAFLQHVLATHSQDIAKVQPDFVADPASARARSAFLVVRGDENVGVVALRQEGAGVGVVELDWVKPTFRDFTPGEFVYRESHALADAGFRTLEVEETDATDEVYLRRMGFAPQGTRWVRELAA
ncbi:hypothetical protein [Demequina sp.]|uniref:hypothetical protein n=1 Tax=Demequina sp. TaxID=2050685 RepID=UPI003D0F1370